MAIDKHDLYKNMEFALNAYSVAEGAFPLWEAVFALIVGQIIIAYFGSHMHVDQKIGLAFLGLILSSIWFILVSLNRLNAVHINEKMLKIQDYLRTSDPQTLFIWPWPKQDNPLKSTWLYRRILPGVMILAWLILISWQTLRI
ncbi:Uncharacterised protein [uncultured archaeon]|nr:Uncharacterised protein [uncultured archaeon]